MKLQFNYAKLREEIRSRYKSGDTIKKFATEMDMPAASLGHFLRNDDYELP